MLPFIRVILTALVATLGYIFKLQYYVDAKRWLVSSILVTSIFSIIAGECPNNIGNNQPTDRYDGKNVTLRLVQVLYRHGDRSPTHSYKNDIYPESYWPQGFGQLSRTGMEQELELGKYIRNVYVTKLKFLSETYKREDLHVRSTSIDRALMSAYSMLLGLYPPQESDWGAKLGWQPIPVHTVPGEEDYLLLAYPSCPVFDKAYQHSVESNPEIKKIMEDHKNFFSYMSEHTGEPNTWQTIGAALDPLYCQYVTKNTTLPAWVTDNIMKEILVMRDLFASFWMPKGYEFLKGGILLKEVTEHMVNKSQGDASVPEKMFIYSAHDSTVVAFLSTLGVFNNRQPPYTACVIVELLQSVVNKSQFFVRLLYKNDSNSEPFVLPIESCGCKEKCPLEKFVEIFKPSLPVNIKQECGIEEASSGIIQITTVSGVVDIVLICAILIMIFIFMVLMYKTRDRSRDTSSYQPVPTEMSDFT